MGRVDFSTHAKFSSLKVSVGHTNQFLRKSMWVIILVKFMIYSFLKLRANPHLTLRLIMCTWGLKGGWLTSSFFQNNTWWQGLGLVPFVVHGLE